MSASTLLSKAPVPRTISDIYDSGSGVTSLTGSLSGSTAVSGAVAVNGTNGTVTSSSGTQVSISSGLLIDSGTAGASISNGWIATNVSRGAGAILYNETGTTNGVTFPWYKAGIAVQPAGTVVQNGGAVLASFNAGNGGFVITPSAPGVAYTITITGYYA